MTPILTNISNKSQIFFSQSPIHFNIPSTTVFNLGELTVELFIWRGLQTADLPTSPTVTLKLNKVNPSDNYIALEISNEIRSFITSSNLNRNNPQWSYNATSPATTSGEGVYFHIVYKYALEAFSTQLGTYFATIGYRYSFEQKGGMYTTYNDEETYRKYANSINYDRFMLNLTTVKETSFSGVGGMITQLELTPTRKLQTGVPCLIAYVNRLGLWSTFTPFGKLVESIDTKREEFSSSFRNPLSVNSQIQHLQQAGTAKGVRKFQINTGLLDEKNNYQVREILQSSKLYLVIFNEDVFTAIQTGITVDSTIVTVDDTDITVDSDTVTADNIGFYSTFTQIPVKNSNGNFLKKTRLNDKSSISYTLEFEETNNFINTIL